MTTADPSMDQNRSVSDDDSQSEYNLSGNGTRGKYAKAMRENGYSITIHHEDGTSTNRQVSPSEVIEQHRQRVQHSSNEKP
jgi:hypothetical protein